MKRKAVKKLTFMLVFLILLPINTFGNSSVASAKWTWDWKYCPALSVTDKTLENIGNTFELSLNGLSTNVKSIKWYTLNKKIAAVKAENNGKTATVTAINKGTTNIKCKIMFYHNKTIDLYCKVTVKSTALKIEITNNKDDNDGRQVMEVGDKYNFNSRITPSSSSAKTYWLINNEYYANVDSNGVVTAKEEGIAVLTAVAANSRDEISSSNIRDQVVIEIVDDEDDEDDDDNDDNDDPDYEHQAKLVTLKRTDRNRLTATFDRSIQTPGLLLINNMECIEGKVDSEDTEKVNYNLSSASSKLTGWQDVLIGYWEGYDVSPDDNSADKLIKVRVNFSENGVNPLPAPVQITQSQNDNDIVIIQFNVKLDKASAEKESNYSIAGAKIIDADLKNNNSGNAVVELTLDEDSVSANGNYLAKISGIKGYNNTYSVMNPYNVSIYLRENTAPILTDYNYIYPTTINLTFNETVRGNAGFKVLQDDKDYVSYTYINNNIVTIFLKETPDMDEILRIKPTDWNVIMDTAGNKTSSSLSHTIDPDND